MCALGSGLPNALTCGWGAHSEQQRARAPSALPGYGTGSSWELRPGDRVILGTEAPLASRLASGLRGD